MILFFWYLVLLGRYLVVMVFVLRMFVFSVACLLCFVVVVIDLHDFVFWFALVWFW